MDSTNGLLISWTMAAPEYSLSTMHNITGQREENVSKVLSDLL